MKAEGMEVTDVELDREYIYFLFGYYFHFAPKQVDEMDATLMETFILMLPKWIEKHPNPVLMVNEMK